MSPASDARLDSLGRLAGTFVGDGTSDSVHLVSSDTALIAELIRRYRPKVIRRRNLWSSLARAKEVEIPVQAAGADSGAGPAVVFAEAASPLGQTRIVPTTLVVRAGRCGARAELVMEDRSPVDGDPKLAGPVLGSLRLAASPPAVELGNRPLRRAELRPPSPALTDTLLARTRGVMDSILDDGFRSLGLTRLPRALEINTLAEIDAADVVPFRAAPGVVRYAVALRERRLTAERDTLIASMVMVSDSAGAWHQVVFRPTLLALRKGRPAPYGSLRRTQYWRRLQAVSDVAYERDNLWMEQVDVRNDAVLWGIVQPDGNVVVAAAEIQAGCE